jgi:hypothetical protein
MSLAGQAERILPLDRSLASILLGFGVFAAAAMSAGSAPRAAWRPALVGLISSLIFLGPGRDALPAYFSWLLPVGIAVSLFLGAVARTGRARLTLAGIAALALVIPASSWPGLPGPLAAAALAVLPVLVLWAVGTRALLARPA